MVEVVVVERTPVKGPGVAVELVAIEMVLLVKPLVVVHQLKLKFQR